MHYDYCCQTNERKKFSKSFFNPSQELPRTISFVYSSLSAFRLKTYFSFLFLSFQHFGMLSFSSSIRFVHRVFYSPFSASLDQ